MRSTNVQIGIDLGTTNSAISVITSGKVDTVKNSVGSQCTPSVFGIDKSKNKIVGKKAADALFKTNEDDWKNCKAEIKRLMGTSESVLFPRLGKEMSPEEISAEILRALKEDALRKYPDISTLGAVITVPAHFSTVQAEATKRAGQLAGFEHVVLLQEPIAAAVAYGFHQLQNENWLIYDLGGGTFDVALISSRDGKLSVLEHSGDNFLGGKDFDWLIVDKLFVPELVKKFSLKDFNRSNPKYKSAFSKLKFLAEAAKIELSQLPNVPVDIDNLVNDESGTPVSLSIELKASQFQELIKPLIDKTINLSEETIRRAGISNKSISKVILVGGPTQSPFIRSCLERHLKIPVDTSVDPLTVVSTGAAIFAESQRIPDELLFKNTKVEKSTHRVSLNFDSLTSETEEPISGVVETLKDAEGDFFIQIQSESGVYSGKKTKLKNGKFFENVTLEPKKSNLFWLYLFDSKGNALKIAPDSFSITHGLSISGAPIPHSIGVAVAKRAAKTGFSLTETFEPFFQKNSVLPLSETRTFKTVKALKKGDKQNALPIKVYEGESDIPDRNELICNLEITGEKLPYDLPENSEVALTIEVDASRVVSVTAYFPTIDKSMNARASVHAAEISTADLQADLEAQKARIASLKNACSEEEKASLEFASEQASNSVKNASVDEDERRKGQSQLNELKKNIDRLEEKKELPQLISEFQGNVSSVAKLIQEFQMPEDSEKNKNQFEALKREGEAAVGSKDEAVLRRVNDQFTELGRRVLTSNPGFWAYRLEQLKESGKFSNSKEADYYIDKAEKAIKFNNFDELKRCVQNLQSLLPQVEQEKLTTKIAGITH